MLVLHAGCSSDDDDDPVANRPPQVSAPLVSQATAGRGASVLFTASCSDPDGTIVQVLIDLSPVGGSPFSGMFDNGTQGDATPGDGTYSLRFSIPVSATPQTGITLPITATDDEGATGTASVLNFEVTSNFAPSLSGQIATPAQGRAGTSITYTVSATDSDGTIGQVAVNLVPVGGSSSQTMYDDGIHGDSGPGDGIYGVLHSVQAGTSLGMKSITVSATDNTGDQSVAQIAFQVVANTLPLLSNPNAFPNPAIQGEQVMFTADAVDPDGSIASMAVDLTGIGGLAASVMHDDGLNGDVIALDGKFTFVRNVSYVCATGPKSLVVTATDDSAGTSQIAIPLTVNPNPGPTITNITQKESSGATTFYFVPQEELTISCDAVDSQDGVAGVTVNLTPVQGPAAAAMFDDGLHGDGAALDDKWGIKYVIPATAPSGQHTLTVTATDGATPAAQTQGNLTIRVIQIKMHKSDVLNGLGGSGSSSVYAAGERGALYHYNGTDWIMENIRNTDTVDRRQNDCIAFSQGAFSVGARYSCSEFKNGVWTCGTISGGTMREMRGVWGSSATDVYAVGGAAAAPQFWRWDGSAWTQMTPLPGNPQNSYTAIAGNSSTQFIAVGYNGQITRGTGSAVGSWADESFASMTSDFYGVWSAASNDYYAVGGDGTTPVIYRSQTAGTWLQVTTVPAATGFDLKAIWGATGAGVWAVGTSGKIWRSTDGTNFSNYTSPVTDDLYAVWGSSGSDVWAAGANGALIRYTGSSWNVVSSSSGAAVGALAAASSTQVWAMDSGANIQYYNGTTWTPETNPLSSPLRRACALTSNDVWAVGDSAAIIRRQNGTWSAVTPPAGLGANNLNAAWGQTAGLIYVGGQNGHFWEYNSGTWTQFTGINGTATVDDIWGAPAGHLYAVAGSVLYYNAGTGTAFSTVTVPGAGSLNSVWGTSQSDVWTVGDSGRIAHDSGLGFMAVSLPGSPTVNFNAVFGFGSTEVFVVGDNFTIYRYDGTTWKTVTMQCSISLLEGIASSNYVFFSGNNGSMYQLFR